MSRQELGELTGHDNPPGGQKDLEMAHNLPGPEVGRPFTPEERENLANMVDKWFVEQAALQKVDYLNLLDPPKAADKLVLLGSEERKHLLGLLPLPHRSRILTHLADYHQVTLVI